jgi:hypothetical protein
MTAVRWHKMLCALYFITVVQERSAFIRTRAHDQFSKVRVGQKIAFQRAETFVMNSTWPLAIAEDSLRYALYPPENTHDKTSAISLAACIESHIRSLLPPNFFWHRDVFELKVVADPESKGQAWMLAGRMRVGDCVDDEWCVVWLLRVVSEIWDVAIRFVRRGHYRFIILKHIF